MPLPRNVRTKNTNSRIRNSSTKQILRKTSELDSLCDKHKVGNLSFRSCKYATADGKVTFIDHDHIRANMKCGIIMVIANTVSPSDSEYDIVTIERAKRERDEKKRNEEAEKARTEIERLKNQDTPNLPEGGEEHNNLLKELVDKDAETTGKTDVVASVEEQPLEKSLEEQTNQIVDELMDQIAVETDDKETNIDANPQSEKVEPLSEEISQNKPDSEQGSENTQNKDEHTCCEDDECKENHDHNKSDKKDKSAKTKREKAIKQYQEELAKKANNKGGNKYYRNFMRDIRSKFSMKEEPDIKYLEVKAETTDMVIDGVKAYRISMPENTKESYFLFIGDLQMKSGLIRQIDPSYKSENVFKEQYDFLERIKAKENSKTKELTEDIIEDDFDDLEELGLSDDELDENVPYLVQFDDNNIKEVNTTSIDEFFKSRTCKT